MDSSTMFFRVSAVACLLALATSCDAMPTDQGPTWEVKRGDLILHGVFDGTLVAKDRVAVHAPEIPDIWGMTIAWVAEDGTEVLQGQEILRFDSGPLEDEVEDVRTELAVRRAELEREKNALQNESIEIDLDRARKQKALEKSQLAVVEGVNFISKLELQRAHLDVKKAELELALAEDKLRTFADKKKAALDVVRLNVEALEKKVKEREDGLHNMSVKAPRAGVVYAPYTRLNWVRGKAQAGKVARPGDLILELPSLDAMQVEAFLRQRDARSIEVGQIAVVVPQGRDATINGTVGKIDAFATTRADRLGQEGGAGELKEIRIVLDLESTPKGLMPGGTVEVRFNTTLVGNALLLPLAAVQKVEGQDFVRLVDGHQKAVTLGKTSTVFVEVVSGLDVGDVVRLGPPESKGHTPKP